MDVIEKDATRSGLTGILRLIDDIVYTQGINGRVERDLLQAKELVQSAMEDLDLTDEEVAAEDEAEEEIGKEHLH